MGDQSAATKAIVDVYDIFGLANQTLQGADAVRSLPNSFFFKNAVEVFELMRGVGDS